VSKFEGTLREELIDFLYSSCPAPTRETHAIQVLEFIKTHPLAVIDGEIREIKSTLFEEWEDGQDWYHLYVTSDYLDDEDSS
jgi:hypothetical protein